MIMVQITNHILGTLITDLILWRVTALLAMTVGRHNARALAV
jgi:hypothetical protein